MDVWSVFDCLVEGKGKKTHKKGTQRRFSNSEEKKLRWPRRYSRSVYPKLPTPVKTTAHARRISKEWR